ncbi:MAG: hypothetical protein JXA49_06610 [Actinobacteria bacterium]|nr:hypothetical protein [Actinomycetota bacterium]
MKLSKTAVLFCIICFIALSVIGCSSNGSKTAETQSVEKQSGYSGPGVYSGTIDDVTVSLEYPAQQQNCTYFNDLITRIRVAGGVPAEAYAYASVIINNGSEEPVDCSYYNTIAVLADGREVLGADAIELLGTYMEALPQDNVDLYNEAVNIHNTYLDIDNVNPGSQQAMLVAFEGITSDIKRFDAVEFDGSGRIELTK